MVVALVAFPFEHPGSFHDHKALVGVMGVHHHTLPRTSRNIGHAETGLQMADMRLGVVADRRIGLAALGLLEAEHIPEVAVEALDRLVGQTFVSGRQIPETRDAFQNLFLFGSDYFDRHGPGLLCFVFVQYKCWPPVMKISVPVT